MSDGEVENLVTNIYFFFIFPTLISLVISYFTAYYFFDWPSYSYFLKNYACRIVKKSKDKLELETMLIENENEIPNGYRRCEEKDFEYEIFVKRLIFVGIPFFVSLVFGLLIYFIKGSYNKLENSVDNNINTNSSNRQLNSKNSSLSKNMLQMV